MSPVDRLAACVRGFAGRRVVVLGDFVVDEFLHGDIARVSREAPVLVLEHTHTDAALGGGGNSVANLHALGARPVPVGVVGDDAAGRVLVHELARRRIDTSHLLVVPGYATPCKTRVLAGGVHTRRQQIVRIDRGSAHGTLGHAIERRLRSKLRVALRGAEGLLVADYGYGAASPGLVDGVARSRNGPRVVTVDSRARVGRYRGITACTPNQEEVENALGRGALDDAAVVHAGRELRRKTAARAVLVTRGARGMVLVERGRRPLVIPAYGSGEVADVTGAGDTVIAAFTVACIAGATLAEAARLANYAAGLVVAKAGTATTTREEILAAVREDLAP